MDGPLGVGGPVGSEVAQGEPPCQGAEPRARRRGDRTLDDPSAALHHHPRVLGVLVVRHVEGNAGIAADVRDPVGALAPDDEEHPVLGDELVPHRGDAGPPARAERPRRAFHGSARKAIASASVRPPILELG